MDARPDEEVRFSRPPDLAGLELVSARYRRRAFPVHAHEEYVVGAMTLGAERLEMGGSGHVAGAGDLILINPGDAHANEGVGDGDFGYSVMYLPKASIAEALGDAGARASLPGFRQPVVRDPSLCGALLRTHRCLAGSGDILEKQSALLAFLCALFVRENLLSAAPAAPQPARIRAAREYIDANFRDGIPLARLSALTGLSPFHLLRSFQRQIGLSPSRYQTQLRINESKRLLQEGWSIAEAAATVGFADQSHLTRHFQRIVGTTPKRYVRT